MADVSVCQLLIKKILSTKLSYSIGVHSSTMAASVADIIVKWSGKEFKICGLDEKETIADLKNALQKETGVLPERQKLLGLKYKGIDFRYCGGKWMCLRWAGRGVGGRTVASPACGLSCPSRPPTVSSHSHLPTTGRVPVQKHAPRP